MVTSTTDQPLASGGAAAPPRQSSVQSLQWIRGTMCPFFMACQRSASGRQLYGCVLAEQGDGRQCKSGGGASSGSRATDRWWIPRHLSCSAHGCLADAVASWSAGASPLLIVAQQRALPMGVIRGVAIDFRWEFIFGLIRLIRQAEHLCVSPGCIHGQFHS